MFSSAHILSVPVLLGENRGSERRGLSRTASSGVRVLAVWRGGSARGCEGHLHFGEGGAVYAEGIQLFLQPQLLLLSS